MKKKPNKKVGIDKANDVSIQLAAKQEGIDDWGRAELNAITAEAPTKKQIYRLRRALGVLGVTRVEDVDPKTVYWF